MEKRVYYFNLSWWVIFYFIGLLSVWASIYAAAVTRFEPLTSFWNACVNIISILWMISSLLFGIFCVVLPLTSKLVISSDGIEWHSWFSVIKFHWYDVDIRIPQDASIERISIKVKNPEIKLRSWARFLPWDAKKGALYNLNHHGLPIAQYGGRTPYKYVGWVRF